MCHLSKLMCVHAVICISSACVVRWSSMDITSCHGRHVLTLPPHVDGVPLKSVDFGQMQ